MNNPSNPKLTTDYIVTQKTLRNAPALLGNETQSFIETNQQKRIWLNSQPFFQYLRRRSKGFSNHRQFSRIIREIESEHQITLPYFEDEFIFYLNGLAEEAARNYWKRYRPKRNDPNKFSYGRGSPFDKTRHEINFILKLQSFFGPSKHVEIAPRIGEQSHRFVEKIPVIGKFVPDVIVFGLRPKCKGKPVGTIFEIDGGCHERWKISKDSFAEQALAELGLFVVRIKNQQIRSESAWSKWVESMVSELANRFSKPAKKSAVLNLKRKIALVNISAWLKPELIEREYLSRYNSKLWLERGLELLREHPRCPKVVKE